MSAEANARMRPPKLTPVSGELFVPLKQKGTSKSVPNLVKPMVRRAIAQCDTWEVGYEYDFVKNSNIAKIQDKGGGGYSKIPDPKDSLDHGDGKTKATLNGQSTLSFELAYLTNTLSHRKKKPNGQATTEIFRDDTSTIVSTDVQLPANGLSVLPKSKTNTRDEQLCDVEVNPGCNNISSGLTHHGKSSRRSSGKGKNCNIGTAGIGKFTFDSSSFSDSQYCTLPGASNSSRLSSSTCHDTSQHTPSTTAATTPELSKRTIIKQSFPATSTPENGVAPVKLPGKSSSFESSDSGIRTGLSGQHTMNCSTTVLNTVDLDNEDHHIPYKEDIQKKSKSFFSRVIKGNIFRQSLRDASRKVLKRQQSLNAAKRNHYIAAVKPRPLPAHKSNPDLSNVLNLSIQPNFDPFPQSPHFLDHHHRQLIERQQSTVLPTKENISAPDRHTKSETGFYPIDITSNNSNSNTRSSNSNSRTSQCEKQVPLSLTTGSVYSSDGILSLRAKQITYRKKLHERKRWSRDLLDDRKIENNSIFPRSLMGQPVGYMSASVSSCLHERHDRHVVSGVGISGLTMPIITSFPKPPERTAVQPFKLPKTSTSYTSISNLQPTANSQSLRNSSLKLLQPQLSSAHSQLTCRAAEFAKLKQTISQPYGQKSIALTKSLNSVDGESVISVYKSKIKQLEDRLHIERHEHQREQVKWELEKVKVLNYQNTLEHLWTGGAVCSRELD